jgi:hypothetical protein
MPYRHYSFLLLGEEYGGLEHLNSMAAYTTVPDFTITPLPNPDSLQSQIRKDWLKD